VVEGGQIVIRPMNYFALSYDHRIIDGREAVLSLVGDEGRAGRSGAPAARTLATFKLRDGGNEDGLTGNGHAYAGGFTEGVHPPCS